MTLGLVDAGLDDGDAHGDDYEDGDDDDDDDDDDDFFGSKAQRDDMQI